MDLVVLKIRIWLPLAVLAAIATFLVYVYGLMSHPWDIKETCASLGQPYDNAYRSENWQEPGQLFPLHNRCNASFDTIPIWVNPAIFLLAVATVVCTGLAVAAITARVRRGR
ncbi:hypothetical protein Acsp01_32660 [Actinoplanes sp. NBRC 101535]|nr:hypothetical protein Acsp01_32660 [Actinoplanes sp. NBRC 101535]